MVLGAGVVERFHTAHALVVGLGGVGATAAELLARAGVGRLTIVDGDSLQESNMNRQILALRGTLGRPKVEVMAERLRGINPGISLDCVGAFVADDALVSLARGRYDVVLDAIDTLSPKLYLVKLALESGNRVVSSMGAGARVDATAVRVGNFWDVRHCRLASAMRKRFRHMGFSGDFRAVYSLELPRFGAVRADESERNRKSSVGSLGYITTVFGAFAAGEALSLLRGDL